MQCVWRCFSSNEKSLEIRIIKAIFSRRIARKWFAIYEHEFVYDVIWSLIWMKIKRLYAMIMTMSLWCHAMFARSRKFQEMSITKSFRHCMQRRRLRNESYHSIRNRLLEISTCARVAMRNSTMKNLSMRSCESRQSTQWNQISCNLRNRLRMKMKRMLSTTLLRDLHAMTWWSKRKISISTKLESLHEIASAFLVSLRSDVWWKRRTRIACKSRMRRRWIDIDEMSSSKISLNATIAITWKKSARDENELNIANNLDWFNMRVELHVIWIEKWIRVWFHC